MRSLGWKQISALFQDVASVPANLVDFNKTPSDLA